MTTAEDQGEDERIRRTASRYLRHFPWLSAAAIEAYIGLLQTLRIYSVAIERYLNSVGQPKPISSARHTVLRILYFADGNRLSQNQISRELGVSRTNITNLIDTLERDGFVARAVNPTDRRTNYVQLTDAGFEFCSTFIPAVAEFMASMFADLSDSEVAQFNQLLARVREGMSRRYLRDIPAAEAQAAPTSPGIIRHS